MSNQEIIECVLFGGGDDRRFITDTRHDPIEYKTIIDVDFTKDTVDIPLCIVKEALTYYSGCDAKHIKFHHVCWMHNRVKIASASTAIFKGFNATSMSGLRTSLIKIAIKDDHEHPIYVGNGAIYDKQMKPILFTSVRAKILPEGMMDNLELIIRVNNEVLINQDDPVNKVIVKSVIPLFLNTHYSISTYSYGKVVQHNESGFLNLPIRVETFSNSVDKVISNPKFPSVNFDSEEVKQALLEYLG